MVTQPLDVSDTIRTLPLEERRRLTRVHLRRRARRRAQVERAEQIRHEAAVAMAARRAAAPQGWREQRPEDRTQVVRVPNRRRPRRQGLRGATLAAFLVTVAMLGLGIYRAERAAGQGEAVAQGVR